MRFRGITRNVVVLGWVSFLTDLASEMLYPVMPLFLVGVLGAPPAVLGLVDGLAEGISSGLRWLGGALSDRFGRRKPFVAAGYAISALSKPVMGLAAYAWGWPLFLIGRCSDRLGKSIRTSARDALIAESTEAPFRGAAFGFHRAMDTTGAIVGPLAALAILAIWRDFPLAWLFFIALAPGIGSVLLTLLAAREILPGRAGGDVRPPPMLQAFPRAFWHLLIANFIFALGNSSDSFLLLRSKELGLSTMQVILAFASYNAVYAMAAAPLGRLSDRVGRKLVIVTGWIIYAGVYLTFAVARSALAPWLLLGVYGLYQAFTEGVTKAFASDLVPARQRAGAIGLLYTAAGLGQLAASLLAGVLWDMRLPGTGLLLPFALGAAFAIAAVPVVASVQAPSRNGAE